MMKWMLHETSSVGPAPCRQQIFVFARSCFKDAMKKHCFESNAAQRHRGGISVGCVPWYMIEVRGVDDYHGTTVRARKPLPPCFVLCVVL